MNRFAAYAIIAAVLAPMSSAAFSQVAGTVVLGISASETAHVASGWSAENKLLGSAVYNNARSKDEIGTVEDIIVTPEDSVSYAIIGVGGFLGIDRRDVAVPMNQLTWEDGKFILPNATKDSLEAMPPFEYARF